MEDYLEDYLYKESHDHWQKHTKYYYHSLTFKSLEYVRSFNIFERSQNSWWNIITIENAWIYFKL